MDKIETPKEFAQRYWSTSVNTDPADTLAPMIAMRDTQIKKNCTKKAIGYVWPDGPEHPLEPEGLIAAIMAEPEEAQG